MNGTSSFFNRQASKKIKRLEDEVKTKDEALAAKDEALAAKDEKIRAERISAIKEIMSSFGVSFDKAFDILKIDSAFKEEYRRLVEER